jgi:SAM-dependent methyltransferase
MARTTCLICESKDLEQVIDLGNQPFADTFVPESRLKDSDAIYPLICMLCKSCGQIQTKYKTEPHLRYAHTEYSYTSSNSAFSRAHWQDYAHKISSITCLKPGSFVVEAGSNDGYLLEQFRIKGNQVMGVDPSPYMAQLAKQRNVQTRVDLFSLASANKIALEQGKADLIIANNVFNHSDDPVLFASGAASLLKGGGFFVFEQPYWLIAFKNKGFDQIYHEHVSYFTVKSVSTLLERVGLRIVSAEVVDYHGGSLRIIAKHKEEVAEISVAIKSMIQEEVSSGVFDSVAYKEYMAENLKKRSAFLQKINKIKEAGGTIIAVGAAAKGNTFLNFYKLDHSFIDYVTDSSPHKQGKYTPVTRIPIVDDSIFARYPSPYALILSWNIATQLKEVLEKYNKNIQFLVP